ncbi:MAG: hypothetical protein CMJ84_00470 [Planctomycetes bacterium]|nr:hypothetical protein [Planctomycetota bacterium]
MVSPPAERGPTAEESPLGLSELAGVLNRSRWSILATGLLTLLIATGVLATSEPLYRASATLVLEAARPSGNQSDPLPGLETAPRVEDELSVLLSRPLASMTASAPADPSLPEVLFRPTEPDQLRLGEVTRLGLEALVEPYDLCVLPGIRRRISGEALPPHRLYATVRSADADSPGSVRVRFVSEDEVEFSTPGPLRMWHADVKPSVAYAFGEPVAYRGLVLELGAVGEYVGKSYLVRRSGSQTAVNGLMARTTAREVRRESRAIELTVTDCDPRRAAESANALCRNYLIRSIELGRRRAGLSLAFLDERIQTQREELARAEEEIVALRARHPETIDVTASAAASIASISAFEVERARTQLDAGALGLAIEQLDAGDRGALARLDRKLPDLVSLTYIDEIGRLSAERLQLDRADAGRYQGKLQDEVTRLRNLVDEAALLEDGVWRAVEGFAAGGIAAAAGLDTAVLDALGDPGTVTLLARLAQADAELAALSGELTEQPPRTLELAEGRAELVRRLSAELRSLHAGLGRNTANYRSLLGAYEGMLEALPGKEREAIDAALAGLVSRVRGNLASQREGTLARERALDLRIAALEADLGNLPVHERELADPLRRQRTHTELLAFLAGAREEADLALAAAVPTAVLVSPAMPPQDRRSPRVGLTLAFSLLLGLFLGAGLAFARASLRSVVGDSESAELATGLSCLGTLPPASARAGAALPTPATILASPAVSALRVIQANLRHGLESGDAVHSLAVASCTPGSARSLACLGLASVFAGRDSRVLLVDADSEGARLQRCAGVEARPGLEEVLRGEDSWRECVHATDCEGLDLLCVGRGGALPAAEALRALLDELAERYDLVVFDLPALSTSAHAHALGGVFDALILTVVGGVVAPRDLALEVRRLEGAGVRLAGLVFSA